MSALDVNTTAAEIAVGQLAHYLDRRDGCSRAAVALEQLYCRMIYTDRGEYPTQAELDLILSEHATGLECNPDRLECQLDPSMIFSHET